MFSVIFLRRTEGRRPRAGRAPARRGEVMELGKSFQDLPLFMTPKQLAEIMGEHEGSIRRGIAEGRIPADKVNGRWRICRDLVFANTKKGVMSCEYDHE